MRTAENISANQWSTGPLACKRCYGTRGIRITDLATGPGVRTFVCEAVRLFHGASQISLVAASSQGKWPRVLITFRNCALTLSMALVV